MPRDAEHPHGGDIWAAAAATGTRWQDWVDFSASINPLGPPPWVRRAVRQSLSALPHYPQPDARQLRTAAAERHGVPPDQVLFGAGTTGLMHLLSLALRPPVVLVPAPTFARYAAAARATGATVREWPVWPEPPVPARVLDQMRRAPSGSLAFLCNPNNPTGQLLPRDLVLGAIAATRRQDLWLAVDEAFLDFTGAGETDSVLSLVQDHPRLVVFRSLTKLYAFPGLRVGYLAGSFALVRHVAALQGPWPVGAPAAAAALAALTGPDYARRTRRRVAAARAELQGMLAGRANWRVFPADANYFLAKPPGGGAALQARLLERRILVRTCTGFTGLGDAYIRLAVRTPPEHQRLLEALDACL